MRFSVEGSYVSVRQSETNREICEELIIEKDLLQRAIQRKLQLATYAG